MRLTLVRHGETEHNRGGMTLGRADVPLNDRGRLQARATASAFARAPDAIYSSPLQRALSTAGAIAAGAGVGVTVEPDLIEMDVGEMEHLTSAELRGRYPEFLRAWLGPECGDARMPGGETLAEVQARAWGAVERMRSAHPDGDVVAITHNFVIRAIVCRALGAPLASFRNVRQSLAALTILDVGEGAVSVLRLNDDAHLRAAGLAADSGERRARS